MITPKTKAVKSVDVFPIAGVGTTHVFWKVRMIVPGIPFFMDSTMVFSSRAAALAMAIRWCKVKVAVKVSKKGGK